jgi:hypothetical protein
MVATVDIQGLRRLHCLDGLALNAFQQLSVGRDVVDQTDDLAGSPDLGVSVSLELSC